VCGLSGIKEIHSFKHFLLLMRKLVCMVPPVIKQESDMRDFVSQIPVALMTGETAHCLIGLHCHLPSADQQMRLAVVVRFDLQFFV
jgi:hypothetical protein